MREPIIHPKSYVYDQLGYKPRGNLYYLKYEADKVIADLEESHKKEVGQLLIEIAELKAHKAQAEYDCAYWKAMSRKCADDNEVMAKQRAKALKRERHHKYKRCLDKAKWCDALMAYFGEFYDDASQRMVDHYYKWRSRWYKLAKKFKPEGK